MPPADGASLPASAPTLQTARLRLRAHRREDYPAFRAIWSDPAVYAQLSGEPSSAEQTWQRMLRYHGLWAMLGYGYWAIETLAGEVIGDIGYADFQRGIAALEGVPELGWVLASPMHGQGYASEALAAVLAWGEQHFGPAHRSACIINAANAASIRLATRHGFHDAGEVSYHDAPIRLFLRCSR